MNELLNYYIKTFSSRTVSLKKKGILVDKPWVLIDNDGEVQKLIFKRDKGLILSKNGKVKEGSWEYFPEAMALLIDRLDDKLLLREQFIDDNVIILKKDGTQNDFFAFSNENTIPDYNIPKYLNTLKCREFKIAERKLLNGNILQIYNGANANYIEFYYGLKVDMIDKNFHSHELTNGNYLTDDKRLNFVVDNGKLISVNKNIVKETISGDTFEIEEGNSNFIYSNLNRKITINGIPLPDTRLVDKQNFIYEIRESKIAEILFIFEYELKNGGKIKVEQKTQALSKGDIIVDSDWVFPLPDGAYKIKGKIFKIKVMDNVIV